MTQRSIVTYIVSFLLYIVLQAALLNKMVIGNLAFCFFYVGFLIYLPISTSRILLLVLGFLVGLVIDLFGDTMGIHMIACTLTMFVRPFWRQVSIGDIGEIAGFISLKGLSIYRLMIYSLPLIGLHHLVIFLVDSIGTELRFEIVFKIMLSTIFTFFVLVIIQLFATKTNKRS